MDKVALTEEQLSNLRLEGKIESDEIAFRSGDLVIAENALTGNRRILGNTSAILTESRKQILKG